MKRIGTIILSVSLSVSISAQDRTPMDKIWEDIEKIISNRQDSKMKINHGDGQLLYVHNGIVGKEFLCSTDCEGVTIRPQRHSRKGIPLFNRLRRRYNFF